MDEANALDHTASARALRHLREAQTHDGDLTLDSRRAALKALRALVNAEAETFAAAVDRDFGGRSWHETMISEIGVVLGAIDHALPRLARWSRDERVAVGWRFWPARARVLKQPLGVVGVIAPWNYPVQLALAPVVGAFAAGCRVVLKPSEHTPATASALAEAVVRHLDPALAAVVLGGPNEAQAMASLPFDKLLFTGSTATGRKVARAAAENLVPLVLELGGKSPAILDPTADIPRAAADIVAGKLLNAGQTCVAPDFVALPRDRMDEFVAAARQAAAKTRPDPASADATALCRSADRDRLAALIAGLDVVPLLDRNAGNDIAPCLVRDPPAESRLMTEEIFGPVLPLVPYDDQPHLMAILARHPTPLALYWFGRDKTRLDAVLSRTRSGGVAVNDTVLQVAVEGLPFGGVGSSGMGAYHGRAGFETFTHRRPVFAQSRLSATRLLRPPYGKLAERVIAGLTGARRPKSLTAPRDRAPSRR